MDSLTTKLIQISYYKIKLSNLHNCLYSSNFKRAVNLRHLPNYSTDHGEVAEVMNNYYINVAAHIGKKTIKQDGFVDHPSIKAIKNNLTPNSSLTFRHTTEGKLLKL